MMGWLKLEKGADWKITLKQASDENKGLIYWKDGKQQWLDADEVKAKAKELLTTKKEWSLKINSGASLPSKNFEGDLDKVLKEQGHDTVAQWLEKEKEKVCK